VKYYPVIPLRVVEKFVPLAEELGVSEVARSPRGFLTAYRKAKTFAKLPEEWKRKRQGFIARHMAQVVSESALLDGDQPTRRHLALIMWAYSPMYLE
jgi:hypothetical protein